jgi:hypothetical protein
MDRMDNVINIGAISPFLYAGTIQKMNPANVANIPNKIA